MINIAVTPPQGDIVTPDLDTFSKKEILKNKKSRERVIRLSNDSIQFRIKMDP